MNELIKTAALILFSTLIVYVKVWPITALGFAAVFLLSLKVNRFALKNRLTALSYVAGLIVIFNTLFQSSLQLSDRFTFGLWGALRIVTLSLAVLLFTSTTSMSKLIKLFTILPPAYRLALSIMFGTIPSILSEWQIIRIVQKCRAAEDKIWNIKRGFLPFVIPLFHRTMQRGEQLMITVASRGFHED